MAKREVATVMIRVYPSTRKALRQLAALNHFTIAELIAFLLKQ